MLRLLIRYGEGTQRNAVLSLPFSTLLLFLFVWATVESLKWPAFAWEFPFAIAFPAGLMALYTLVADAREFRTGCKANVSIGSYIGTKVSALDLKTSLRFYIWVALIVVVTLLIGQMITFPLFIALYLKRWGGYGWLISIAYAFGAWLVLYVFYDQVLHIYWHPSWLDVSNVISSWINVG